MRTKGTRPRVSLVPDEFCDFIVIDDFLEADTAALLRERLPRQRPTARSRKSAG